jgi:GNAT superfamily N-acetyltransferase
MNAASSRMNPPRAPLAHARGSAGAIGERVRIELARPGEGRMLGRLISASLELRLRRLTIWASPLVDRYVESLLAGASPEEASAFYLLRVGGRAAGLAAFRLLDGEPFLNHLYVAPRWRGRRLGSLLLREATGHYLGRHRSKTLSLDVFAGRPVVETWYARLGFRERERRASWTLPAAPAAGAAGSFEGLQEAGRRHAEWGFSSFVAATASGRYRIGRLPGPWFRLTDLAAAVDPELGPALLSLDPGRKLLLVAASSGRGPAGGVEEAVSRRLEINRDVLYYNLQNSGAAAKTFSASRLLHFDRPSGRAKPSPWRPKAAQETPVTLLFAICLLPFAFCLSFGCGPAW